MIESIIGILGGVASVIGLLIVFFQVKTVKNISLETKNSIFKLISLSDVTKSIKLIQEIQNYNRLLKFEIVFIKLQELKHYLIEYKSDEHFVNLGMDKKIKRFLVDIDINIQELEGYMNSNNNTKNEMDITKVNILLEQVSNLLIESQSYIKRNI